MRLSGDRNPLHRDPAFAKMVGFPAAHPAWTLLLRHRLPRRAVHAWRSTSPNSIRQFDVRFSKPVFPGETLVVELWQGGSDDLLSAPL